MMLSTVNTVVQGCKKFANAIYNNKVDGNWDGKFLPDCNLCNIPNAKRCGAIETGPSTTPAQQGKLPSTNCEKNPMPEIFFVNGINNTPEENCSTTKAIANATCSKVIGVYNRSQGVITDLFECLGNIFEAHPFGGNKPTDTVSKLLSDAAMGDPPKGITIYAHSQGGLITREAIAHAKNDMRAAGVSDEEIELRMRKTEVRTFGTAKSNWPEGPNYEQYTNPSDPVPKAIYAMDASKFYITNSTSGYGGFPNPNYLNELTEYTSKFASISSDRNHIVKTKTDKGEELKGLDSHNMEKSYVPYLRKQRQENQKNGKELKCAKCDK